MLLKRACLLTLTLLFSGAMATASAHEAQEVGGLELVAGWADEPAYVGHRNAVQLFVRDGAGEPVEGAEADLRVEVTLGDASTGPLDMRSVFGSPGEYRTDLVPTRPGAYEFQFTGEIEGEQIDARFSPPGFDEVHEPTEIEFPAHDPSRAELAAAVEGLEARLATDGGIDLGMVLAIAALVTAVAALGVSLGRRSG